MVIFHSYVKLPEGRSWGWADFWPPRTAITLMKELKLPKHEVARLERRVEKLMAGTQQPLDSGDGAGGLDERHGF